MITKVSDKDFILQNLDMRTATIKNLNIQTYAVLLIKADYCGHCKLYLPEFQKFSEKNPDIPCMILETTENEQMVNNYWSQLVNPAFTVRTVPTLVIYDSNGSPVSIVHDRHQLEMEIAHLV